MMLGDYQILFNIAMAVAVGMAGWVVGRITKSLDVLDNDVRAMPDKYVSKLDYRADIHDIKDSLRRILERLDHKVDK